MAVSREPRFVPGVWGPYYSAMVPGLWLTEGGQSATGALIDHVIDDARARRRARCARRSASGTTVYALLNDGSSAWRRAALPAELTRELHVLARLPRQPLAARRPDPARHGERAQAERHRRLARPALPRDDPGDRARHAPHHRRARPATGYRIDTLLACGGDTKNPVFVREHADVTGCRIVLPREPEAVLLGAAMLGAVACGRPAERARRRWAR